MKTLNKLLIALLATATLAQAGGMLIAAQGASASFSADEVRKIFLGKTTSWSDGSSITVGYQTSAGSLGDFLKGTVGKKPKKFKKYWLKKVFSGNGNAPKTFDSVDKAVNYVKSTSGALVYIDAASAPAGVAVISFN